jgi:hypothetical protein
MLRFRPLQPVAVLPLRRKVDCQQPANSRLQAELIRLVFAPGRVRRRKQGLAWRLVRIVRNGIGVARVHSSSMINNTCCTMLLLQGAPASAAATPT